MDGIDRLLHAPARLQIAALLAKVTEMDALIAYLQMMGTLVDFSTFKTEVEPR